MAAYSLIGSHLKVSLQGFFFYRENRFWCHAWLFIIGGIENSLASQIISGKVMENFGIVVKFKKNPIKIISFISYRISANFI